MPHPDVLILGYSQAAMFLQQREAANLCGIIAIAGQREHAVETDGVGHKLILNFDDTETPPADDLLAQARLSLRRRQASEFGLILSPPTMDDARAIIKLANELKDAEGTLLCHCHAGISRSPAAALICLTVWGGPGSEKKCVAQVRAARPAAVPHLGLIRFADEALERRGKLITSL